LVRSLGGIPENGALPNPVFTPPIFYAPCESASPVNTSKLNFNGSMRPNEPTVGGIDVVRGATPKSIPLADCDTDNARAECIFL